MLDVSATAKNDLKTGIERVAQELSRESIKNPGEWQVEPIRFKEGRRLYARNSVYAGQRANELERIGC